MSSTEENFRLKIWKGDWGLASVDIHSLYVVAYAKFCEIPLTLNTTCNPFKTPRGHLPVLESENGNLDSVQDIIYYFREHNHNPDSALSPKQCAEILAYDYMLKEMLNPALQFIWWVDRKNFSDLIRPWYAKAVPFPLNFHYPQKYEKEARALIESLFPNEDELSAIESKLYSEAQKCLTRLSTRLGESNYFFGSQPTSLDALVYAYLAPLLKTPLPNPALQNHLKACTNLEKFVSRISQNYFAQEYKEYKKTQSKKNNSKLRSDSDDDFPNKRRDQFLAGLVAAVAMIAYALTTGIVEVSAGDDYQTIDDTPDDELDDEKD